jgi:hypothetical protein
MRASSLFLSSPEERSVAAQRAPVNKYNDDGGLM